jgi:hypothetical protein
MALESASVDAMLQLGIGPVTVTIESSGGKPDFVWMAHRSQSRPLVCARSEFALDSRNLRGGAFS